MHALPEGTYWMRHLTQRIVAGAAAQADVDLLYQVANNVKGKPLCALGDFATEAVTSGIERFRADFEARLEPAPVEQPAVLAE